MNTHLFKFTALAAVVALAACTNDVIETPDVQDGLELGNVENVVRISLSNSADTRAARPIGSSEADNNVNRLAFILLNSSQQMVEGVELEALVDDENEMIDPYEGYYSTEGNVLKLNPGFDTSQPINVKFRKLPQGAYKIIAYGYNYTDGVDSKDEFPYSIVPAGTVEISGSSYQYLLKCENVVDVQEIFAGCNEGDGLIEVNKYGKFENVPDITLTRQVAALMAYFENVPAFVNNTQVYEVTVSSKANVDGFYIPSKLITKVAYNGISSAGMEGSDWVNYLTFDLREATNFEDGLEVNSVEHYDFGTDDKPYLLADGMKDIPELECNENTLFGSCFLLAFSEYCDFGINAPKCATLNICYWDKNGELIHSVPLKNGDNQEDNLNADSYQYGINCNYFYSIGKKTSVDGEDENGDVDNPLDIDEATGYDNAKVTISNDWDDVIEFVD